MTLPMIEVYLELERRMLLARAKNENRDSIEEDTIMDCMDVVWQKLSDEEIKFINTREK